jgi:hypothetical protein
MSYIFTASVTVLKTNLTSTKQFTDLKAAKKWVRHQSRHKETLSSIDYVHQREEEEEPVWKYKAHVRNYKWGTLTWRFFDNLPEAREWLMAHGQSDEDMRSLTRIIRVEE